MAFLRIAGRKGLPSVLPKEYFPHRVENGWTTWWNKRIANRRKDGTSRERGKDVHWIPGLDHAGIATQTVVERKLAAEKGITRHEIGKETFLREIEEWRSFNSARIRQQLEAMGLVLEWDKEYFTMDEARSQAVTEAFVRLWDDGLVRRATRMVHWCPHLRSAISDIEAENMEINGRCELQVPGRSETVEAGLMYTFAYPLSDDGRAKATTTQYIEVATTRPETMYGDVAVAVHPEDPKLSRYIGRNVFHPLRRIEIPVIGDSELVQMGKSLLSCSCSTSGGNISLQVMDERGRMNDNAFSVSGMNRWDARDRVVDMMKAMGLYRGKHSHAMSIPVCSRSGDVLEPMEVPQWYVRTPALANQCLPHGSAIIPQSPHAKEWQRWLEGVHEWCVSRQMWWGHRIPAYRVMRRVKETGEVVAVMTRVGDTESPEELWVAGRSEEEARERAVSAFQKKTGIRLGAQHLAEEDLILLQDEDVLDTWFSSGILPLSALGWPKETSEVQDLYPLSLMETGADILFFWVARMAMLCRHFHPDGTLPFNSTLLHGMVRDKAGRKMSKSLGNAIDPMHLIEGASPAVLEESVEKAGLQEEEKRKAIQFMQSDFPDGVPAFGSDALRMALLSTPFSAATVRMDVSRVEERRRWANKMWQLTRWVLGARATAAANVQVKDHKGIEEHVHTRRKESFSLMELWLLNSLSATTESMERDLAGYRFSAAIATGSSFLTADICDLYLEFLKVRTRKHGWDMDTVSTLETMQYCVTEGLKLMHPFMPFLTEHLYQYLCSPDAVHEEDSTAPLREEEERREQLDVDDAADDDPCLLTSSYPSSQSLKLLRSPEASTDFERIKGVAAALRSLRGDFGIPAAVSPPVAFVCCDELQTEHQINQYAVEIQQLGRVERLEMRPFLYDQLGAASMPVGLDTRVVLPLDGMVDAEKEMDKASRSARKVRKRLDYLQRSVSAPGYETRAPPEVQERDRDAINEHQLKLQAFDDRINVLRNLIGKQ